MSCATRWAASQSPCASCQSARSSGDKPSGGVACVLVRLNSSIVIGPLCIVDKLLHNLGRIRTRHWGYHMVGSTVCAMLVVANMAAQEPAANDAVAALTGLEKTWNDAELKLDAATLGTLFADDITIAVPGMPEMSKNQALGFLQSGRMKFDRYETS